MHGRVGGPPSIGRSLPPISGIIHERPGMRPYLSAYGHTDTVGRAGSVLRSGAGGYGRIGASLASGVYGRAAPGRYGHVGTALPPYVVGRPPARLRAVEGRGRGIASRDRPRFAAGRPRFVYGGSFAGGYGLDLSVFGGYGEPDAFNGTRIGGADGTYGATAGYGGTDGGGGAEGYASEAPLPRRFAEPPLAPSPWSADSPYNRYAYAASEDVGPGPRIVTVDRASRRDCACAPRVRSEPTIYRFGVGTAY